VLALIAGQGRLPELVAETTAPMIVALDGLPPGNLTPDRTFRLERLGTLLADLKADGVTQVCFAGSIRRPPLDPAALDAATAPLVPRIMQALGKGDDGALRIVLDVFSEAGFAIRAAHELRPDLLPPEGVLTKTKPGAATEANLARARAAHASLAAADVGQAVAVARGQVIALETAYGTDWMLEALAARPDAGGLLWKAPKAGQDRRIDLPTIGPDTVRRAAQAGLEGIALEKDGVMILDRDATVAEADARGLFLLVTAP
jgi:DUF1009 family protein